MAQITWANATIDDLQRLREYYEQVSPKFALQLVDQLIGRTRVLIEFPRSGRLVPEFNNEQLREVQSGNYRIIYRLPRVDKVEIVRIYRSSQLLTGL